MFRVGDKVVCINNKDLDINVKLTPYKIYVIYDSAVASATIKDDNGYDKDLFQSRFISLKEYRKQKINKIIKKGNKL